ncbi:MAG: histidine phosphatase family protein [Clostridia bacterium]|nr:histidine phosphatase family protein [Clostridia bacterium]
MQSYVINLIRHGAVDETLKGKYIGSTDVQLSKKGREGLVAIREGTGYPQPQKLYSSPLLRCTESCEIIYPGMDINCLGSFRECSFGEWEGKSAAELSENPLFAEWLQNSDKTPPPGGESGKDFAARISKGFERLVETMSAEGITEASLITHGGVIMTILAIYGLPQAPSYQWRMDNGYGFSVRVNPFLWMRDRVVEVFDTCPRAPKREEISENSENI